MAKTCKGEIEEKWEVGSLDVVKFGEQLEGVEYTERPSVYGICFDRHGHLAAVAVEGKDRYFLPGGGREGAETDAECLVRECREELGYEITVGEFIGAAEHYSYSDVTGYYLKVVATFYFIELQEMTGGKVEDDHSLIWLTIEEAEEQMMLEHQAWGVEKAWGLREREIHRLTEGKPKDRYNDLQLRGIGGWLIFLAIGVAFRPLALLSSIFNMLKAIFTDESVLQLLQTDFSISLLTLLTITANLVMLLFSVIIAYHFFGEKRNTPMLIIKYFVTYICLSGVLRILYAILLDEPFGYDFTGNVVGMIIWSLYLTKSIRVKNTFVR